jgi:phosphoribosylformylglycinamidine synthase
MAMGERTPLALIDAPASGRMAVAEAITNIASARIARLGDIRLSANWMAAAGHPGEDEALYDTVKAVGMELCPALGITIPVGKDSMSMKTAWQDGDRQKQVTAPLSLIVSAFAPVLDVRKTVTPQLRTERQDTTLLLVDLGCGQNRLGGSSLAQVYGQMGDEAPDLDDPALLKGFFSVMQELLEEGCVLAYHDRSDGGLFATLAEMAFAGHTGVDIRLDATISSGADIIAALFAEELGGVIQVGSDQVESIHSRFTAAGLGDCVHAIGSLNTLDEVRVFDGENLVLARSRVECQRLWAETSYCLQSLRDNSQCAEQEYDSLLDAGDPGLEASLSYDVDDNIAAPYINTGVRPSLAVLREQGVNGQYEMAAAFDRAGFRTVDVHMSDLLSGRHGLSEFVGLAACGGFSYGDVLGAGEGWAKTILYNNRARDEFEAYFQRPDTFALGVCNGCQMLSTVHELIPGTEHWPRFVRNLSEQYEARFVSVEVQASNSVLLQGMEGSRIPVVVAHGEGRAEFGKQSAIAKLGNGNQLALRYVDNYGAATELYPANPNGSPQGITGVSSADGRVTIMMPHPERIFRTVQNSWSPDDWNEDGAWMRLFYNARKWVG